MHPVNQKDLLIFNKKRLEYLMEEKQNQFEPPKNLKICKSIIKTRGQKRKMKQNINAAKMKKRRLN